MNKRVAVFIDLPNITYSFENRYQIELDPQLLVDKAKKYGTVAMIKAFADFKERRMEQMYSRLKASGIDAEWCQADVRDGARKDYVDFTMLEHIYQSYIDDPNIDVYVFMTGDGHFSGVAAKFRNRLDKSVVICGVPGTVSGQLVDSATSLDEIIVDVEIPDIDVDDLIRHIEWGEKHRPPTTFSGIRVSYRDRTSMDPHRVLSQMVDDGLLTQQIIHLNGQEIRETKLNRDHPTVEKVLTEIST